MADELTHVRTTCRLCGSEALERALSYCPSVPVDNYRPRLHKRIDLATYDMDLYLCRSCGHAQLRNAVDPNILFGDYIYTSTSSPGLKKHFVDLVERIFQGIPLSASDLVVDVGCNDGLLLEIVRERGCRTLGVDPSKDAIKHATARGLDTFESFLTCEAAEQIVGRYGRASLVTATNVFSHADNLHEFAKAISELLRDDGWFVFEVSYLKNLLYSGVWDYVYHEHLAHHSVKPLLSFLRRAGFRLVAVEQIAAKGGSIRCIAQKSSGQGSSDAKVHDLVVEEELLGLYEMATYRRVHDFKCALRALTGRIIASIPQRALIASYGASATSTVISQELGYAHRLAFAVDDNPARQRTLTPGFLAPVLSQQEMEKLNPALVIVSAWRFADSILSRCSGYLENGGKVFVPLPSPRLIAKSGQDCLET